MDYGWILCDKAAFWGEKLQKKKLQWNPFFFTQFYLFFVQGGEKKWKEIVNCVRVSESKKMWSSWTRSAAKNVKCPVAKFGKLWKINGNVEKIEAKEINSSFVTKGSRSADKSQSTPHSIHQHISEARVLIMFSSPRIKSCLKSFLIYVSLASTQLLVNLNPKKLSHLQVSHRKGVVNSSKVYIVIYLLLSVISISNCAANALVDSSSSAADGYNLEELGAIFHKVAYQTSTTTTKRSIIDNVYVPSITTVPTPSLTTFRYVVLLKVLFLSAFLFWVLAAIPKEEKIVYGITNGAMEIIHSFFVYFTRLDYMWCLHWAE